MVSSFDANENNFYLDLVLDNNEVNFYNYYKIGFYVPVFNNV